MDRLLPKYPTSPDTKPEGVPDPIAAQPSALDSDYTQRVFEKEFESEPLKAKLGGILLERELLEAKIAILDDGHPYLANSVATDPSNSADAGIVPAKRRFN